MPGQIQKIPQGLLGFLQLKTGGRNPATLSDIVVPTWDLARLYLEADAEYVGVNSTINAGGYTITASAPQNEAWIVTSFNVGFTTDVGEAIECALCRAPHNNTPLNALTLKIDLGANDWAELVYSDTLYLAPGESLGVLVNAITGVVSINAVARFIRLPI